MRIALVGNAQSQAARLRRLLPFEAEILLDDETRATRVAPLEVDAALSIRFNAADIAAVRCRLLQCTGVGIDGIALAELPADTIVSNVHEHEIPIAEYVLAGILDHEIGLFRAEKRFESAQWGDLFRARKTHGEVHGKTIGIIGFGRIGKAVAIRARAFGMRILAVNRSGRPSAEADVTLPFDRIGEVLAEADYLVLACPLTEDTRGLIDRDAFARMKPSALLVNVARGEVVDEEALWNAMSGGRIGGALIDTWYTYPTLPAPNPKPSRFPFETLPNVRCTPHMSGWTEGLMARRYKAMAENIAHFARGEALANVVWCDGHAVGQP
jgi:prepilin-type processing-associated H-X9-DG protein